MMASLSARRAWIEILRAARICRSAGRSLSARRAWIEIINSRLAYVFAAVALRKESVDRNIWVDKTQSPPSGRSPQGERG